MRDQCVCVCVSTCYFMCCRVPAPGRGLAGAGRSSPPNPIKEKDKYVDVNFYQLIVVAPTFIKYRPP